MEKHKVHEGLLACMMFAALMVACASGHAASYYVAKGGDDAADGLAPERAWRSLARVNRAALEPGDAVLFRRGNRWRGQLRPQSGQAGAPIRYGAYGEGSKPELLGSVTKDDPDDWRALGDNLWIAGEATRGGMDGPGLLAQDDFAEGTGGWNLHHEAGASARLSHQSGCAALEIRQAGTAPHHIQFYSKPFALKEGALYVVAARIRASETCTVEAPAIIKSGAPWTRYARGLGLASFGLGPQRRDVRIRYLATMSAEDGRINFLLGKGLASGITLEVGRVQVHEIGSAEDLFARDVGNIIFDGGPHCGVKVWVKDDLDRQDEYWYDEENCSLVVYSEENPAERYDSIECALRDHIIEQGNRSHIVYEDLTLLYGGAHGIGGGWTHHITVRRCDFGFIGGGDQRGGEHTVRFGNGVEFWGAAHDCLVEGCRFWEIYDAAMTNQSSGPATPQYNITYRNNLVWNSEYSFEYWNRPEASETHHIYFEHNTCVNAGFGWGHAQRPDPSGRHLCFYTSPARDHDIYVRNNIFYEAAPVGNAFYAPMWPREQIDRLVMDHNCWYQSEGNMASVAGEKFPMAAFGSYRERYHKEPHSFVGKPGLVDFTRRDFHLLPDSPCIDAGSPSERSVDFDGVTVPQGRAPDIGAYEYVAK
ncbi:MAG TPA: hypothetical protein ENN80_04865 [Candidatus Hydrogenedentes bacterium]|nr:hypothetical protein [Candidatus Hydrogenedentota bacterium]